MQKTLACTLLLTLWLLTACKQTNTPLFTLLDSSKTHIGFANNIVENNVLNMINYEYLYNGGGVGIGDFNNDSLQDIYFTSSLGQNKLYLNKGNFAFEDVTATSGVDGNGKWCKGVAVVDINNDGLNDLYVCAATWDEPERRRNLLYINKGLNKNGIPLFEEQAKSYGLDDTSSTHMASFFDYDNDGDLDVYLLVNDLNKESPNTFRPVNNKGTASNTDKLFRNDWSKELNHPVFTNVSLQAGITWEGYGLGVNIVDINKDGWKDILVSNDYLSGNLLYINNKNGTFSNQLQQYFQHTSLNAMGNDVGDINNDGLVDVIETDMAAEDNYRSKMMMNPLDYNWYLYTKMYQLPYQTVRNTMQINRGCYRKEGDSITHPIFSEIAFYSNTAYTDWSWAPLLADVDNDGYKDLMVTNGLPKDITDLDFIAYRSQNKQVGVTDLLLKLPEVKISNYLFKNNGNYTFTDKTADWGWNFPTFSAGIAYADLDNDGDMDVVINNTNMPASILQNNASQQGNNYLKVQLLGANQNLHALGSTVDIYYKNQHQTAELTPYRGYMSSVQNCLHFGLGNCSKIDSVIVTWPNGEQTKLTEVTANQTLNINYGNAQKQLPYPNNHSQSASWFNEITNSAQVYFLHQQHDIVDFNIQRNLPHKFTQNGPALACGDLNGDGLEDWIVGGNSVQQPFIYFQKNNGSFEAKLLNSGDETRAAADAGICLFDADNDNDLDIYFATEGFEFNANATNYADRLYINNGKGFFTLAPKGTIPIITTSKSCVKAADFDGDGKCDLFIGGRVIPGKYPLPESGYLLKNISNNGIVQFTDVTANIAPQLNKWGLITDALWTDYDNDNDIDLIVAGEWTGIEIFSNNGKQLMPIKSVLQDAKGWWSSLAAADMDNDGDMDYIAGNYGLNGFYKANAQQPVSIYANDYAKTGRSDILMSHFRAGEPHGKQNEFSALYRDQIAEALPVVKKSYDNYQKFAQSNMSDILSNFNRNNELVLHATELASVWIENKGGNNFEMHRLPAEAQWSPLFGIVTNDFNDDGNVDILLNGNDYGLSPFSGRADASYGLVLQGDGKGNFSPLTLLNSGFTIMGNGKALAQTYINNKLCITATTNSGPMFVFKSNSTGKVVTPNNQEQVAFLQLKNGKQRKVECYNATSFYSQSSNKIWMNNAVAAVTFINNRQQKRNIQ